jgi:hypothetical protein
MKGYDDSNTFGPFIFQPSLMRIVLAFHLFLGGIFLKFPNQPRSPGTNSFFSTTSDEFFDCPPISVTFRC